MRIAVSRHQVALSQADDFGSFSITCPTEMSAESLGRAVADAGIGTALPGGTHVMVRVDAIRSLAGDEVTEQWERSLTQMVAYAHSHGWTSPDGSSIRAHVDRRAPTRTEAADR